MRRPEGILDTNAVILLPQIRDREQLPVVGLISAVTLAELAIGPLMVSGEEREARLAELRRAERDFDVLPFDEEAAFAFREVAGALRARGRKASARSYDALIAATALGRRLPLHTCNPDDFAGIDGLDVVAVSHPADA